MPGIVEGSRYVPSGGNMPFGRTIRKSKDPLGFSFDSPAATVVGNELHFVIRGLNEGQIWQGHVNRFTDEFSGWTLLDGGTPSAPTLTSNGTHVCLVVRDLNGAIYYRFYNISSRTWSSWTAFPNGAASDTPGAMLVGCVLYVVVRGSNLGQIWHCNCDAASAVFSGWTLQDGATPSPSVLASNSTDLCHVIRGDNNTIYYRWFDIVAETWTDWSGFATG